MQPVLIVVVNARGFATTGRGENSMMAQVARRGMQGGRRHRVRCGRESGLHRGGEDGEEKQLQNGEKAPSNGSCLQVGRVEGHRVACRSRGARGQGHIRRKWPRGEGPAPAPSQLRLIVSLVSRILLHLGGLMPAGASWHPPRASADHGIRCCSSC